LTGHQVTIPNEELARSEIENIGRRPHIRRVTDIRIPLDTPPVKAKLAVQLIRDILDNHEGMPSTPPPRVYLNEFNPDSLNVRMMYWYEPADYWQFLDFGQRINLKIMNAFHGEGIKFALPSSKMIMASAERDELPDGNLGNEVDSDS
jgi:MscS family membrane protein